MNCLGFYPSLLFIVYLHVIYNIYIVRYIGFMQATVLNIKDLTLKVGYGVVRFLGIQ